MIVGIGTDILDVKRVSRAIQKDAFRKKCYTEEERNYMNGRRADSYAGVFCAKEALVKALGTGFRNIDIKDIEVIHDGFGKPEIILYNQALERAESLSVRRIHLSISHTAEFAVATVILER